MKPLFEPNAAIARLAATCDAIKASREAAGREHWNDAERIAFRAAAKACGAAFDVTGLATVRGKDDSAQRITQREVDETARRAAQRERATTPAPVQRRALAVYENDKDDREFELR